MRPYLAILHDSFREAVASRTLPFLLVFFTIVLLALAPLGLREDVPWKLRSTDIADVRLLTIKLRAERAGDTPAKRVIDRLPEDLRKRIADPEAAASDKPPEDNPFGPTKLQRDFAEGINERVLSDAKFFSKEAWDEKTLPDEAKSLMERGVSSLSQDEVRRLNRLAFDTGFSGAVLPAPKSSAELTWLGGDIPLLTDTLRQASVDKPEVQRQAQDLLRAVSSWIVGPIGLLVAIFVTSTIIPRMFEAGAIDLLLSKPISRTGLYLTRFFSGCAFVFITFSYFIVGLWLIVGLRLGVWNNGLLLTIPLLLFAFAVIFAVSAGTGVIWRNPIVSVLLAVLVWGAGFAVGVVRDGVHTFRNGDKVREIVLADGGMFVSDKNGHVFKWSDSTRDWNDVFKGQGRQMMAGLVYPLLGPVYDPASQRLIAADIGPGGTNRLLVGSNQSEWERADGATLPPATRSMFVTDDGKLIAAGQAGIFRFEGDFGAKTVGWQFWGLNFTSDTKTNGFVRADGDENRGWSRDVAAAVDRASGDLIVLDRGAVSRYRFKDSEYEKTQSRDLETDKAAVIGFGGTRVLAAFADGRVVILDAATLKDVASFTIPKNDPPRLAEVSRDGALAAVLTHGGTLFLYDARKGTRLDGDVRGNGDVSSIAFASDGSLWTADRLKRLTRYDGESLERKESFEGSLSRMEMIYRYALRPLAWVLPNTYGLRNAETYLFTDRKSEAIQGPDARLESERLTYDVWGPIWQNLAFLTVVLGLTCVYIARKDF
ncbi:MAG: ABC transporter permease subunit [Planctomycetota bacterium]|nr:ABC transporter permease subunit [Planctomycetaceae bacterium]MDQ3330902.1 ABC transporter permease subunit [Planctomycetota bacterium]